MADNPRGNNSQIAQMRISPPCEFGFLYRLLDGFLLLFQFGFLFSFYLLDFELDFPAAVNLDFSTPFHLDFYYFMKLHSSLLSQLHFFYLVNLYFSFLFNPCEILTRSLAAWISCGRKRKYFSGERKGPVHCSGGDTQ